MRPDQQQPLCRRSWLESGGPLDQRHRQRHVALATGNNSPPFCWASPPRLFSRWTHALRYQRAGQHGLRFQTPHRLEYCDAGANALQRAIGLPGRALDDPPWQFILEAKPCFGTPRDARRSICVSTMVHLCKYNGPFTRTAESWHR